MQEIHFKEMIAMLEQCINEPATHQPIAIVSNLVWTFDTIKEFLDAKKTSQIEIKPHKFLSVANNLIFVVMELIPNKESTYISMLNEIIQLSAENEKTLVILYSDRRTGTNQDIEPQITKALEWNKNATEEFKNFYCIANAFSNGKAID